MATWGAPHCQVACDGFRPRGVSYGRLFSGALGEQG